jgi:NitT/TauT family transport system substrate-binding protein
VLSNIGLAGAVAMLPAPHLLAAEPRLETTTIRLAKPPALCVAPLFIVEELLRADGFTDIRYVDTIEPEVTAAVGSGNFSGQVNLSVVAGLAAGDSR